MTNKKMNLVLQQAFNIAEPHEIFLAEYIAQKIARYIEKQKKTPILNKVEEHERNNKKILDFGCSKGLTAGILSVLMPNSTIYGIDQSKKDIVIAQKTFNNISFQTTSGKLPFDDNSFDVVYASLVFHHIAQSKQPTYIQELMRVLKPNGLCIFIEFNPYNPWTKKQFNQDPQEKNAQMIKPKNLKYMLINYGKTTVHYTLFFQRYFHFLRLLEPFIRFIPFGALYLTVTKKK